MLPEDTEALLRIELPRFLWGEIRAGDQVGQAVVVVNGKAAVTVPLCAASDVSPVIYEKSIWQRICDIFAAIGEWLAGWFD